MTTTSETRRLVAFCLCLCPLLWGCGGGSTNESDARPFVVRARPVESPLEGDGPLVFRAGFELSTRHLPFGGFSGLVTEGDRLLAVSDHGFVWQSRLVTAADGTLIGFTDSLLGPLHDPTGAAADPSRRFDSEEVAPWIDGWLVSFEGDHRIFHYRAQRLFALSDLTPRRMRIPAEIASLQQNGGLEAMTRLADGRLVVFAENEPVPETESPGDLLPVWVGRPALGSDPPGDVDATLRWDALQLERTDAFHPTGAATLPTGDVLLLERSWNEVDGVRVRLSLLPRAVFQPGAVLRPIEIKRLENPDKIDNFEAVHVSRGADGSIMIYLMSDDNFNKEQRTLLFQLELLELRPSAPTATSDPDPASPGAG